jgi:hypothetical protein
MSGFEAMIEEVRFAEDSPLEGAVSSELVSESKFPGYWERYREFRLNPDPTADKRQPNQSLTTSIPW